MDWKRYSLPIFIVSIAFLFSCGGGGSDIDPHFEGDNNPGVEGNLLPPVNPADLPQTGAITGALGSAPLGTDPAFNVVEASDIIETNLLSGTSSVRGTSAEDRVFWVAVVGRGGEPIEGNAVPPLTEGDDIDLYMRYQVYEGELTIARQWFMEAAGLDYIEPVVVHPQAGVYEAIFPFTIPFGSAGLEAIFTGALGAARSTSLVPIVGIDGDSRDVTMVIVDVETYAESYPPETNDNVNDLQGDAGGCLPGLITVSFNGNEVHVESTKEISNVVGLLDGGSHVKFESGEDGEPVYTEVHDFTFSSTLTGVWVKSGCNDSGDGPGYGQYFDFAFPNDYETDEDMAQFAWEDLLTAGDYDYNDFVGRLKATEYFVSGTDDLVQVTMVVKAVARAAAYDADWQFNVGAAFPGNTVICYVDQYYVDNSRHGDQRIYISNGGVSIPVFTPIREALPNPTDPSSLITNGVPGTRFVDGDYAVITMLLEDPMPVGTFTPAPYNPELRVAAPTGVYTVPMWRAPGDEVDSNGRPLAFIVPDTYAWPLEGVPIWDVYSGYDTWVDWIDDATAAPATTPPSPDWWDLLLVDPHGAFDASKFGAPN